MCYRQRPRELAGDSQTESLSANSVKQRQLCDEITFKAIIVMLCVLIVAIIIIVLSQYDVHFIDHIVNRVF